MYTIFHSSTIQPINVCLPGYFGNNMWPWRTILHLKLQHEKVIFWGGLKWFQKFNSKWPVLYYSCVMNTDIHRQMTGLVKYLQTCIPCTPHIIWPYTIHTPNMWSNFSVKNEWPADGDKCYSDLTGSCFAW